MVARHSWMSQKENTHEWVYIHFHGRNSIALVTFSKELETSQLYTIFLKCFSYPVRGCLHIWLTSPELPVKKEKWDYWFILKEKLLCKSICLPKCPSTDEWIKKMLCVYTHTHTHTHTHNEILLSHKKEWNFAICSNIDGLGGHYAKWNKPDTESQILHDVAYV